MEFLLLYYIAIFIFGLFIGSFLNVVSDRVVSGKSLFISRSACDSCDTELTPLELIPVVSFFAQKGKCKNCNTKLSYYYPVSEVLTGVVFTLVFWKITTLDFGGLPSYYSLIVYFYLYFVACVFIVLTLTDLKYTLLPNKIVLPAIIIVFVFMIFNYLSTSYITFAQMKADPFQKYLIESGYYQLQMSRQLWKNIYTVISAFGIGTFFYLLTLIKGGRAMGGGDVKLAFLIGLINPYPQNLLAIFIGFLSGALVSVLLIGLKVKTIKDTIPFGQFLILGSFIALLWGPWILDWYINLF